MRIQLEKLMEQYKDNLYIIAFHITQNQEDANDAVQDAFVQYYMSKKQFESEQHIKAWLIRVTMNKANDKLRSFWRKHVFSLEEYMDSIPFAEPEQRELFACVSRLHTKYRVVIQLFYYEDYSVKEIAQILKISESNVKVRLSRGRELLRKEMKGEWDYE